MKKLLREETAQDPEIVKALRRVIKESGKTQVELAAATGVNQGQLSKFIRGKESLGFEAFSRLTEHFKLTLCPGKGKKPESH